VNDFFFLLLLPLYNKSYSILRCIDSVLNQDYKSYEIVIVNDGSTDNSMQIVLDNYQNEISNRRIKIIDQKNQGVSAARNNGVKGC